MHQLVLWKLCFLKRKKTLCNWSCCFPNFWRFSLRATNKKGGNNVFTCVACHPQEDCIATGHADGKIRLWYAYFDLIIWLEYLTVYFCILTMGIKWNLSRAAVSFYHCDFQKSKKAKNGKSSVISCNTDVDFRVQLQFNMKGGNIPFKLYCYFKTYLERSEQFKLVVVGIWSPSDSTLGKLCGEELSAC